MVILESISWVTIVSTIAAVVGVVFGVLSYLNTRQNKKGEELKALERLARARNELCVAMNIGEINTLLNNAITLCDKRNSDSKSLNSVWNQLQPVLTEVESKWNSLKLQLASSGNDKLSEQLGAVIQEYLFCFRDVETVVAALGCEKVDDVDGLVTVENSEEMRCVIEATKPLYTDVYEFVKQVISLRFQDLDIPDYAAKIRQLWDDESKLLFNTNTRLLAALGNPIAQNAMGGYYYEQKQFKKAFVWYKKAAEEGYAEAQNSVGWAYEKGEGVEKNEKRAFEWYKKAAEQDFAKAQRHLGICYDFGIGVEKDAREAVNWYRKSAEQGEPMAQHNLGVCYYKGEGVEKDEREAFIWFKKAAEQGNAEAQCNLGVCYVKGEGVEKDEREAFKWFKKAAEQGNAEAQGNLGYCYDFGISVEKDERVAFKWSKKAAEQGYAMAQCDLGVRYEKGEGVEKDVGEAFNWFKKAAEQGLSRGHFFLGQCFDDGVGCDQDYNKAFYWYIKASESKEDIETYSWAMYKIGCMFESGKIGLGSIGVAFGYYEIAAQCGHHHAQYRLGYCYETGKGGNEVDIEKAKYWYRKAAEQGDEEAIASLARLNAN